MSSQKMNKIPIFKAFQIILLKTLLTLPLENQIKNNPKLLNFNVKNNQKYTMRFLITFSSCKIFNKAFPPVKLKKTMRLNWRLLKQTSKSKLKTHKKVRKST